MIYQRLAKVFLICSSTAVAAANAGTAWIQARQRTHIADSILLPHALA
jgi:hypothetical protein